MKLFGLQTKRFLRSLNFPQPNWFQTSLFFDDNMPNLTIQLKLPRTVKKVVGVFRIEWNEICTFLLNKPHVTIPILWSTVSYFLQVYEEIRS